MQQNSTWCKILPLCMNPDMRVYALGFVQLVWQKYSHEVHKGNDGIKSPL